MRTTGSRETKAAAATRRTFCQARCTRSSFSTSTTTDEGYFMGGGAEEVEEGIVNEQSDPGANTDEGKEKL